MTQYRDLENSVVFRADFLIRTKTFKTFTARLQGTSGLTGETWSIAEDGDRAVIVELLPALHQSVQLLRHV